jgi:hypothetical protein
VVARQHRKVQGRRKQFRRGVSAPRAACGSCGVGRGAWLPAQRGGAADGGLRPLWVGRRRGGRVAAGAERPGQSGRASAGKAAARLAHAAQGAGAAARTGAAAGAARVGMAAGALGGRRHGSEAVAGEEKRTAPEEVVEVEQVATHAASPRQARKHK